MRRRVFTIRVSPGIRSADHVAVAGTHLSHDGCTLHSVELTPPGACERVPIAGRSTAAGRGIGRYDRPANPRTFRSPILPHPQIMATPHLSESEVYRAIRIHPNVRRGQSPCWPHFPPSRWTMGWIPACQQLPRCRHRHYDPVPHSRPCDSSHRRASASERKCTRRGSCPNRVGHERRCRKWARNVQ